MDKHAKEFVEYLWECTKNDFKDCVRQYFIPVTFSYRILKRAGKWLVKELKNPTLSPIYNAIRNSNPPLVSPTGPASPAGVGPTGPEAPSFPQSLTNNTRLPEAHYEVWYSSITEHESGWGSKPDGSILFTTKKELEDHIEFVRSQMEKSSGIWWTYSGPEKMFVNEETYKNILNGKHYLD